MKVLNTKKSETEQDFQCQTWKDKETYLIQNVKKEKEENGKKRKGDFFKKSEKSQEHL